MVNSKYMKRISLLFSLCFVLLLSSCVDGNSRVEKISIARNLVDEVALGEIFNIDKTMLVKEDSSHLMRMVKEVRLENDVIYISDGRAIFTYSADGSFLGELRSLGRGPGEYSTIWDFSANKDNLFILDQTKILKYDSKAEEFLAGVPLDFYASSIYATDDALYVVSGNQEPGMRIHRYDPESLAEISSFQEIPESDLRYRHFMAPENFFLEKDNLFFHESLNNTVYIVQGDTLCPKYVFDFWGTSAPDSFWDQQFNDVADAHDKVKEVGYSAGLPRFATNGRSILYFVIAGGEDRLLGYKSNDKDIQFNKIRVADDLPAIPINKIRMSFPEDDKMLLLFDKDQLYPEEADQNPESALAQYVVMKVSLK